MPGNTPAQVQPTTTRPAMMPSAPAMPAPLMPRALLGPVAAAALMPSPGCRRSQFIRPCEQPRTLARLQLCKPDQHARLTVYPDGPRPQARNRRKRPARALQIL